MQVEAMMPTARRRLTTIQRGASLKDAAKLLTDTQISLVVVCDAQGSMVGVITESDIIRQVAERPDCPEKAPVTEVMTSDVVHCHPTDLLDQVWANMKGRGLVHVPVVDHQFRPTGVVNARDALQFLLGEVRDEEMLLRGYVMGIGYR